MENKKIEIRTGKNWWLMLILGVLYAALGIMVVCHPIEAYATLSLFLAIAFFMGGVFEVVYALCNTKYSGWGWSLASGIITFIIGAILVNNPATSAAMIPFILAFAVLFRGMSLIGVSSEMKHYGVEGWGWALAGGIIAMLLSFVFLMAPGFGAFTAIYLLACAFLVLGICLIMFSFKLKGVRNKVDKFVNN